MKLSALLIFTKRLQLRTFPVIASDRDFTNALSPVRMGMLRQTQRIKILTCGTADMDIRHMPKGLNHGVWREVDQKTSDISKCVLYFTMT